MALVLHFIISEAVQLTQDIPNTQAPLAAWTPHHLISYVSVPKRNYAPLVNPSKYTEGPAANNFFCTCIAFSGKRKNKKPLI